MKRLAVFAAALIVFAVALAGCGGGKKVAARVNKDIITEDDFYNRCQAVDAYNLEPALGLNGPPRGPAKAGEYALQTLIAEKLILQLAADKHAVPTDAQVNEYVAFAKKYRDPRATLIPPDPYRDDAAWQRDVRSTLAYRNMALQPLKLQDSDLRKLYDQYRKGLTEPDRYHLRLIDLSTPDKAQKALDALKKGLPFETVALTQSENKQSAQRNGDIGWVTASGMPPSFMPALKNLKPGQYTQQPVVASMASAGVPAGAPNPVTQKHYFIIQLVEMQPGRTPTFEEVKPLLENVAITQRAPQAFSQVQQTLRDYQDKANIQINLKGYENLLKKNPKPASPGAAPGGQPAAP